MDVWKYNLEFVPEASRGGLDANHGKRAFVLRAGRGGEGGGPTVDHPHSGGTEE